MSTPPARRSPIIRYPRAPGNGSALARTLSSAVVVTGGIPWSGGQSWGQCALPDEVVDALVLQARIDQAPALVRATRRAYSSPSGYGSIERFTVTDIHEFARRLQEQGVRASEDA